MRNIKKISISEALRGKNVLLTGASGFLAKVWLCMALVNFPDMGKIYLLLRKKKGATAKDRFREILNSSPAFSVLHQKLGEGLEDFLSRRLAIIEGDVHNENFGISQAGLEKLRGRIDLILHCAGLVNFQPDLRESYQTNVLGALEALELSRKFKCPLLHISTAFVAGARSGEIPEAVNPKLSPSGDSFDPEKELADLKALVESPLSPGKNWVQIGKDRANQCGWPNTYSYTKGLAEALIASRAGGVNYTLLRPTIVESALAFPFSGWNEGLTTCAPLSYLLSDWMKIVTVSPNNYVDIIPVDKVCEAMSSVAAALLMGKSSQVYHCGTSQHNPITARFLIELMGLSQQRHLRSQGKTYFQQNYLSRIGNTITEKEGFFTPQNLKALTHILTEVADLTSKFVSPKGKATIDRGRQVLQRLKWDLIKAEYVIDTFKPYLRDYNYRFLSNNLKDLDVKEEAFRFTPERVSWSEYIINIHEPGLRKWCYPLMQGKKPESFQPKRPCSVEKIDSIE